MSAPATVPSPSSPMPPEVAPESAGSAESAAASATPSAGGSANDGSTNPLIGRTLTGFRIGITSDRRSDDMIAAFERRGAQTLHAPALRMLPLTEDAQMIADTRAIIDAAPDVVLVTTAYGMRRWIESAEAVGLGDLLAEVLGDTRIMVRGPKARGAVRAAGFDDDFIADSERTRQLVDHVLSLGASGMTIAVQSHGYADEEQLMRLRSAGARVLTVTPYQWAGPASSERLPFLVDAICDRKLDAVTFTSAPAADALLSAASEKGRFVELVEALRGDVVAAAVGDVTAAPLRADGIEPIVPERFRLGALIKLVCDHLAEEGVRRVSTPSGVLEIRGTRVGLAGTEAVDLSPGPLAVLCALVRTPGAVVDRAELMEVLPGGPSERGLEMTVSRLRAALPDPALVVTVVKRGYRLKVG